MFPKICGTLEAAAVKITASGSQNRPITELPETRVASNVRPNIRSNACLRAFVRSEILRSGGCDFHSRRFRCVSKITGSKSQNLGSPIFRFFTASSPFKMILLRSSTNHFFHNLRLFDFSIFHSLLPLQNDTFTEFHKPLSKSQALDPDFEIQRL